MQGIQVARDVHRQVNLKEMACLDSSLLLLPPTPFQASVCKRGVLKAVPQLKLPSSLH